MGSLLKEALKALCGVNHWCYAVFWKIGMQNPKLLIWEESHTQSTSSIPRFPEDEKTEATYFHDYANLDEMGSNAQTNDKVRLLVNKMMMDNHINIVGEGLVGRVAFTGQHQWILTDNLYRETHPPEVLKELCQQFSAGVQTVVVVPVHPHGVVQFGSFMTITEEKGFIDDVKSMVHQLGHVHEGLLAENYVPKELLQESNTVSSYLEGPSSRMSHLKPIDEMKFDFSHLVHQSKSGITKAEPFAPTNLETQMNHQRVASSSSSSSSLALPSTNGQNRFITSDMSTGTLMSELGKTNGLSCKNEMGYSFRQSHELSACKVDKTEQSIATAQHNEQNLSPNNEHVIDYSYYYTDDTYVTPSSGDDLFDVLGADFKNKLFGGCNNNTPSNVSDSCVYNWDQNVLPCNKDMASSSDIHSTTRANSHSTIFTFNRAEHLLDTMIGTVPSTNTNFDENIASHGTTMPSASSLPYGVFEELSAQKPMLMKAETSSVCSFRSMPSKEETQTHDSQGSSICGSSQLSSWTISGEKGRKGKQSSSASTGCSKKSEETSKTNRKRLKPGENPRPRPKDRQMIQDRVKELREIVPNGAKCSIDALLERTIKHMLFLESVTKHADKLKQTGDSKILSKDGGLLLKDNIGGATWAYEVGSQSMVCPIIVEDLNQPRQMLVEMLCEERGLFLEIADIIRGMGLTILKGVMETRSDKIWARFAVEANRDVTRMEIFISLVRLLEQSAKTGLVSGDQTDT